MRVQGVGDLASKLQRQVERKRAALEALGQCLAVHNSITDVGGAVLADADVVEYADIGMIQ